MKLPNGYGSVYKLSGNRRRPWAARITVGWNDLGHPKYKFLGYFVSRKEALAVLADFNRNPYDPDADLTFKEVYDKWSAEHFPRVSESNVKGYKASYKLCELIYDMKISEIKLDHLQHIVDSSGKNTPTLRKLKVMLGLVYDYAIKHEITTPDKRNLVSYIDISKSGNPNKIDRAPFNSDEISLLWSKSSDKYIQVILILIYSGVRISELLDLRKENVNLKEKYFDIIRSKTASGVRRVPIADKILPFITSWYDNKSDYLICTPDGGHFLYRNYYDSYWKAYMTDLGLSHKPHDTRHTCVSLMAQKGIDERIIKKIVGHKGQGVTQTVYTHFEMQQLLETINLI